MSQEGIRAIFYIDGLNLYYGIREFKMKHLKWLDLKELAEKLLAPKETLSKIKYFTSRISPSSARDRQDTYIAALEALYNKLLKVTEGNFQTKDDTQCSNPKCRERVGYRKRLKCLDCQEEFKLHVEKQTDVNIACEMMDDLRKNQFDVAYLISADSDLLEPIKRVALEKSLTVAFPPNRGSDEIKKLKEKEEYSISYSKISRKMLESCVLPNTFNANDETFERPDDWKEKKPESDKIFT